MRFWVYLNGEVPGSYEPAELAAIPGFTETAMVCPASGGIEDRNWRHAGEFPEIASALDGVRRVRDDRAIPRGSAASEALGAAERPAQAPARDFSAPRGPEDILDETGSRIFSHVSELMKELENRREERAYTQALQRQLLELKNELQAGRERIQHLEGRSALIPGYEDRERRLQELVAQARSDIKERDESIGRLERQLGDLRLEVERARKSEQGLGEDLKRQSGVNEDLHRTLGEKEAALARAFALIRRLEELLKDLVPGATAGITRAVPYPAPPAPPPDDRALTRGSAASEALGAADRAIPRGSVTEPSGEGMPPPKPGERPASEALGAAERPAVPPTYTVDAGRPESPVEIPPEGEVRPVPAPWQLVLKRIINILKPK